jgi:ubiquitin-protein ligase
MKKHLLPRGVLRLAKEIKDVNAYENLHIDLINDDITEMKALIIGPDDSAFEGGFFIFDIRPASRFPMEPHVVLHQTTNYRVHPNLYAGPNGKVCLSILHTWSSSKDWSPMLTLEKILLTIQALMDNNPLANEPGHEDSKNGKKNEQYRIASTLITLSHCVHTSMNRNDISNEMKAKMENHLMKNKEKYVKKIVEFPIVQSIEYFHGDIKLSAGFKEQLLKFYSPE